MTSQQVPEHSLSAEQRRELESAHARLRSAVANYERYLGAELQPGQQIAVHPVEDVAAVQAQIESAERELWHLREQYLGWTRPAWAPGAAQESDWFSVEDEVYDKATPAG